MSVLNLLSTKPVSDSVARVCKTARSDEVCSGKGWTCFQRSGLGLKGRCKFLVYRELVTQVMNQLPYLKDVRIHVVQAPDHTVVAKQARGCLVQLSPLIIPNTVQEEYN